MHKTLEQTQLHFMFEKHLQSLVINIIYPLNGTVYEVGIISPKLAKPLNVSGF